MSGTQAPVGPARELARAAAVSAGLSAVRRSARCQTAMRPGLPPVGGGWDVGTPVVVLWAGDGAMRRDTAGWAEVGMVGETVADARDWDRAAAAGDLGAAVGTKA